MTYIKHFFRFLHAIYEEKKIIFQLTNNDFKSRYLGSFLGLAWAFLQPTVTVLIIWFIHQVGFKTTPINNMPFILWLLSGMVPWFFISESISSATTSIIDNSYLVKKVVFRVSILPIVKILSALFVHVFFVLFLIAMLYSYGFLPNIYYLQILYYLFASIMFILGLSWMTSSLVIFVRDLGQFVIMVLQFAFWMTPIFWSIQAAPVKYQFLLKLNPFFYITEGYRNTFIYHKWFWEDMQLTIYYWSVTIVVFVIGAILFRHLRKHFADVL